MAWRRENAAALAELLLKVSRHVDAVAHSSELKPAQWSALRYLAHAAPSARTNRAFADYHQTTTGTVAVTFRHLGEKGLIERVQSTQDKRQAEFSVTSKGEKVLASDPLNELVEAIRALNEADRKALAAAITELFLSLSGQDAS